MTRITAETFAPRTKTMSDFWKNRLCELFLCLTAMVFVTVFSFTTSPIYSELSDTPDSAIFQVIGKYWAEGAVPYRDLWDMKGPFIFWVNAVGYALTGTRTGVYIFQIFSLFLTLTVVFKLLRGTFSRWKSVGLTLLSLAGLSYVYEGGNLTEEYLLPLLAGSFFGAMKWINRLDESGDARHPWPLATLYGATLGLSLMSRLTNALSVCAVVAVVSIVLLGRREFRNLLANVTAFVLGFGVATLPFFVYFHHLDALEEMWNATFVYALEYAGNPTRDEYSTKFHYFFLSYLNSMLLMAVAVAMAVRRRALSVRIVLWFLATALPFVWFCWGNGFAHYGMTVFPLFAVAMVEMRSHRWLRMLVVVVLLVGFGSKVRFAFKMYHWENAELNNIRAYLKESPEVDRASFVAYNCTANVYLDMDVRPGAPLFSIQDRGIGCISAWHDFVMSTFRQSGVKWVLVSGREGEKTGIQEVLDTDYTLVYEDPKRHLKTYRAK